MKTIFKVFRPRAIMAFSFTILTILAFSLTTVAQNRSESSTDIYLTGAGVSTHQFRIEGNVLYDQTFAISDSLEGIASQQFPPPDTTFDCQAADDFVVPEFEKWKITDVVAIGRYFNGPGPALDFNIYFYADDAGVPGTEIIALLDQAYSDDGLGTFTVNLSEVVDLQPGKYWVSVQVYIEAAVASQWGWQAHLGPILDQAVWRNPLDGFGTGFITWTPIQTIVPYWVGSEFAFALLGLSNTVPVELTSFTAIVNNKGNVVLNWSTATELNNQMFEIERKSIEGHYSTIGYVEGYGTTTEPQVYSYTDNIVGTGTYFYRLKQIDFGGLYEYSDEIEVEVNGPLTFALEQNYPNPFNPSTRIKYSVPENGFVKLSVYNLVGEEVSVLVNESVDAGFYEVTFSATNLPSGTYFYKLQSSNKVETKKMILLK